MAAAPNSVVSLQKELEKCEPTIRHSAVMRTEMFISFHNQDGASTSYMDICWPIHVMLLARCMGHAGYAK